MTGDRQCNYIFGAEVQRNPDRNEAWVWVTWYPDTATGRESFDLGPTGDQPARDLDGYTMCERSEWPFRVHAFDARPQSDRGPVCNWADAILEVSQDHLTMG